MRKCYNLNKKSYKNCYAKGTHLCIVTIKSHPKSFYNEIKKCVFNLSNSNGCVTVQL